MQAGKLRKRLILQTESVSANALGEDIKSWSTLATVWGGDVPLSGREAFYAQQVRPEVKRKVTIRYKSGLQSETRILSPRTKTALAAAIADADVTAIVVDEDLGVSASEEFRILIDSELLKVTAGHGTTTWTVERGVDGTTAASHDDASDVRLMAMLHVDSVINVAERDAAMELMCTEEA